jgi:cytoskeleton protein RodZ
MSSVGESLRRERLRKELSLEQISRETKISPRQLEAIEKDQFELLPGGVFAKSFVRQYARFLGMDETELAAEVERVIHPGGDVPAFTIAPPEPAFKVPRVSEWEGSGRPRSSILPALALVVAVVLVCSAVYAWWQRSRQPSAAQPTAAAQKAPALIPKPTETSAPPPVAADKQETSSPSVEPPVAGAPETASAAPVESANPAATLHVSLTSDADDWLRVSTDGKVVMSDVLHPSQVKTFAAVETLQIRIGDAGSLQMTVNGKPAGPLGPRGQVRNVEVTRDGVHILPPPPKPAPAPALEPL